MVPARALMPTTTVPSSLMPSTRAQSPPKVPRSTGAVAQGRGCAHSARAGLCDAQRSSAMEKNSLKCVIVASEIETRLNVRHSSVVCVTQAKKVHRYRASAKSEMLTQFAQSSRISWTAFGKRDQCFDECRDQSVRYYGCRTAE